MGTVLITGASRGIGAATARLAAADGNDVAVSYASDEDAAAAVVAEVEALGRRAFATRADVAIEADVIGLFNEAEAALGPLTDVVANAGIVAPASPLSSMSAERIQRVVDVNVVGTLLTAREAARRLSTEHGGPGGSIILVGSAASRLGSANEYVDYAATKGAVDTLTIGLAIELAPYDVRVVGIRPGLIETEIHAAGRIERIAPNLPMQRPGTAEEVAAAIVWAMSSAASYVSGTCIDVAGGR